MNSNFQLPLYIMKVKSQEDQWFCNLNFSEVMSQRQCKREISVNSKSGHKVIRRMCLRLQSSKPFLFVCKNDDMCDTFRFNRYVSADACCHLQCELDVMCQKILTIILFYFMDNSLPNFVDVFLNIFLKQFSIQCLRISSNVLNILLMEVIYCEYYQGKSVTF